MNNQEAQFDYPVKFDSGHVVADSNDYSGDRFTCESGEGKAFMHTGAWPAWNFCPFCGRGLE